MFFVFWRGWALKENSQRVEVEERVCILESIPYNKRFIRLERRDNAA